MLIGYVAYLKIKEQYLVEKVTCSNKTCVRFCCFSADCDFKVDTTLENTKALENKDITSIDGSLCQDKFENSDTWKFEEVKHCFLVVLKIS